MSFSLFRRLTVDEMPPVSDNNGRDRFSFLGKQLPPAFKLRVVTVAPGGTRLYDESEWRDSLVVVERGTIEIECLRGGRRSFVSGDVLCLVGLSVRALHNRWPERAVLVAVSRIKESFLNPNERDHLPP
jgi:hypothetical protein